MPYFLSPVLHTDTAIHVKIITILLYLRHSCKNISYPDNFLPIHMHTVECPEEILPSKDAFHWHGQPTKQMAFHLDEREKEGGKEKREKERERELDKQTGFS